MPRPIYILCCQSGAEDKYSGLLSHYNVFEKFLISKIDKTKDSQTRQPAPGPFMDQMRVVCVWMKTEEDSAKDEFECTIEAVIPPTQKRVGLYEGKFQFTK